MSPSQGWDQRVPTEIWLMILALLDVKNVTTIELCSRFFRNLLHTHRSVWSSITTRLVASRRITPHSFDLSNLSRTQLRALAEGETRLEHWLCSADKDSILNCAPLTDGSRFRFRLPPGAQLVYISLLAGGRGVFGTALNGASGCLEAMCWDLSHLSESFTIADSHTGIRILEAVTSISGLHPLIQTDRFHTGTFDDDSYLFQGSKHDAEANCLSHVWGYPWMSADDSEQYTLEVLQMSWDQSGVPNFQRLASYQFETAALPDPVYGPYLDSDLVVLNLETSQYLIWDWQRELHGRLSGRIDNTEDNTCNMTGGSLFYVGDNGQDLLDVSTIDQSRMLPLAESPQQLEVHHLTSSISGLPTTPRPAVYFDELLSGLCEHSAQNAQNALFFAEMVHPSSGPSAPESRERSLVVLASPPSSRDLRVTHLLTPDLPDILFFTPNNTLVSSVSLQDFEYKDDRIPFGLSILPSYQADSHSLYPTANAACTIEMSLPNHDDGLNEFLEDLETPWVSPHGVCPFSRTVLLRIERSLHNPMSPSTSFVVTELQLS